MLWSPMIRIPHGKELPERSDLEQKPYTRGKSIGRIQASVFWISMYFVLQFLAKLSRILI